jgi:hypothetical protein
LEEGDLDDQKEYDIKWSAVSMYGGNLFPNYFVRTAFANIETHLGGSDMVWLLVLTYQSLGSRGSFSLRVLQTVASIYSFFLAVMLYPDVQRKAQEEIDRVVGDDRLPTFADRELLPYVDALSKEVMRWNVVAPLGHVL